MSIFIHDIGGYVGREVFKAFESDDPVVGSLTEGDVAPENATVVPRDDPAAIKDAMLRAEMIVFSTMHAVSEAMAALKCLRNASDTQKRVFVVISSTMCWARTPQPEGKLLEEGDYRIRKPSVKFQDMKNFETLALDSTTENLQTIIIGAGLVYGLGEHNCLPILRDAWLNSDTMVGIPALDGLGGKNVVPTIHVSDLATITYWCATSDMSSGDAPKGKYFLAIDNGNNTLEEMVQAVSEEMATGATRVNTEFEIQELAVEHSDVCSVLQANIEFDNSTSYAQTQKIELKYATGFVDNIEEIANEFKAFRKLKPIRVVISGPPNVGKSYYAQRVSEHYSIPVVTRKQILEELSTSTSDLATEVSEVIALMEKGGKKAPKVFPPDVLGRAFRWKLSQNVCKNKGWILDDFPDSYEGTTALFMKPEGDGDDGDDAVAAAAAAASDSEGVPKVLDLGLVPSSVVCLSATDNALMQRFLDLTEEEAKKYNDQKSFKQLLDKYKKANADDKTELPRNFFENVCKVEAMCFNLEADEEEGLDSAVQFKANLDTIKMDIEKGSGKPFNFRPTFREQQAMVRKRAQEEQQERERVRAAEESEAKRKAEEREQNELEEKRRLDEVARQELEVLEVRAMPLRDYLMENVIPTLTEGLLEVCKVQPDDPVDYLAEWLFKNNPEDS